MWLLISSVLTAAASIWVYHLILERYLEHLLECETNEESYVWQETCFANSMPMVVPNNNKSSS